MKILVPTTITDSMVSSSTIAEPAAGETAWAASGTYALGDLRIRATTHRVYKCILAHTGRTALPEVDTTYWSDYGPTAKWAMFDTQVSTQSTIATPLTVVLRPGFFNAVDLYGLDGASVTCSVKDAPAGTVIYTKTLDLTQPPLDWYDWAFGTIRPLTKANFSNITPYPDAELTLTITAATGVTVKCGMVAIGDRRFLLDGAEESWGGTQYGATAEPVDFSYVKTDDFGNTTIAKRRNATDMRAKVIMPRAIADSALAVVQSVLSVPVSVTATDASGYDGLSVFGLLSGQMSYDSDAAATLNAYVKGLV